MSTPTISCILPLYNQGQFVREAVASILAQTDKNFELIVIDDASTDNSARIVESFNDQRITLIRNNNNIGTTATLNIGMMLAKGEYVARMDADDVSLPNRFELQRSFMEINQDIAVCGSHVLTIGSHSEVVKRPLGSEAIKCFLLAGPPFSHSTVMMRRSVLERHGLQYEETFRTAQDYDLWLRLLSIAKGWNIDKVLLKHRIHDRQVSVTSAIEQCGNADLIRKQVLSMIGLEVSDNELARHTRLFRQMLEPGEEQYRWVEAWLQKIADHNSSNCFFDSQVLSNFLAATFKAFQQSSHQSVTTGRGRLYLRLRAFFSKAYCV